MRLDKNIYMYNLNTIRAKQKPTSVTNGLLTGMSQATSYGKTKNGALTFKTTSSPLLDFYAQAGSMRNSPETALDLFKKAFAENRLYAIRTLFYLRDVRGGQGERKLFRSCLQYIGTDFPEVFEAIIKYIPEYGRFDDMFFDNEGVFEFLKKQLKDDIKSETPSLLAKWLPTINASSANTKEKAKVFAKKLKVSNKNYRIIIRDIRKKIKLVEQLMSARKWGNINYSSVPSQASRIYKNAFKKHDEVRYNEFINRAIDGKEKINASTLYPYQIYKSAQSDYSKTLEALWYNLPDYTMGKNAIVVADVSGSMNGDPMSVSVSLALYFAERNSGQFKNHFLTFSSHPSLQAIRGNTLRDKMNSIETSDWGGNTDLQATFDLILNTAISGNVPKEEMPETLYIISDMEFDCATGNKTNFELAKEKFEMSGYKLPNVVFWNVNATHKNIPVQQSEQGVSLVSGFSPVIFKFAVENKTPEMVMMDTINSDRYNKINL